jgi:hypothetical protein
MTRRTRRQPVSRSWFAIIVAAFVALVASGLPELVVEVVTGEAVACAVDCDGSDGQKHCPPNCSHGLCAKVARSVPAPLAMVQITAPPALAGTPDAPPVDTCHSRDSANEVFHPPRA